MCIIFIDIILNADIRTRSGLVAWSRKEVTEDVQIGITIIIVKTKNSSEHV